MQDISDPIFLLTHLFVQGLPLCCKSSADANDDGRIDISDPITMPVTELWGPGR